MLFLVKQATLRVLQGTGSIIEAKLFYSYSKTWLIYTVNYCIRYSIIKIQMRDCGHYRFFRFPVNFRLTFEVDRIIKLVYWSWCRRFSFFLFLWTRCFCHITAFCFNGQQTACDRCYQCNDAIN